jgi:hypothetical protein
MTAKSERLKPLKDGPTAEWGRGVREGGQGGGGAELRCKQRAGRVVAGWNGARLGNEVNTEGRERV